ncbi:MAG: oligosaccharide flippase family protein [Vicinamibacteria bacterium]
MNGLRQGTAEVARPSSAREASIGSAVRLAAEIAVRFSSIVATLWLTRSLGVTLFGEFILCLSVGLMIAELCDLGLNAIVVPQIVRDSASLRTLLWLKAAMTAGVGGIGVVLVPVTASLTSVAPFLLALATLHFLGASWIEFMGTSLRALGRRGEEAALLLLFRLALVALVIGAPFGLTLRGSALSYAAAVVPALVLGLVLLGKHLPDRGAAVMDIRAVLRQAAPMGVNGYLSLLSTRVELFVLQGPFGSHVVGLFGGALRIVESLLTLPSAIAGGALPAISREVVTGSRGAAQRTFGLVVWLAAPCAVGLAVRAPEVLAVLGPGFVDGAPALKILSVGLFLCFSNVALFHALIGAGETAVIPRLTGLRVGVALALALMLIPSLGLVGAAISFTGAEAFLLAMLTRAARLHVHIDVARPVVWSLGACVPMAVALSLWNPALPISIALAALLFCMTGAAILRRGTEMAGLA